MLLERKKICNLGDTSARIWTLYFRFDRQTLCYSATTRWSIPLCWASCKCGLGAVYWLFGHGENRKYMLLVTKAPRRWYARSHEGISSDLTCFLGLYYLNTKELAKLWLNCLLHLRDRVWIPAYWWSPTDQNSCLGLCEKHNEWLKYTLMRTVSWHPSGR